VRAQSFTRQGGLQGDLERYWSEHWGDKDPRDFTMNV